MIDLQKQLNKWALSTKQLSITTEMANKLGSFLDEAKQNEKTINVFLYTYLIDGKKVTGFIAAPKVSKSKLPVIILNRGGTGDFGLIPNGQYFTRIARMVNWGYVVLGTYYPGNSFSEGKDERGGESDLASVLELYDLIKLIDVADENRIGMYGQSRGGMMTYLCMKQVSWIRAAVTVGGVTNLERSLVNRPEMRKIYEDSFGNTDDGIRERSAVNWANDIENKIPLCIIHGGADERVSPLDAIELARVLEDSGHLYSLHIIENGNHMLTNYVFERDRIIRQWMDRYVA